MAYHFDLVRLMNELKGPKGVAAISEEFNKLSTEIQRLSKTLRPSAEARLKKAQMRMRQLHKMLNIAQKDFESELNTTVLRIRKRAKNTEKRLKMVLKQKNAAAPKAKKTTRKKASSRRSRA